MQSLRAIAGVRSRLCVRPSARARLVRSLATTTDVIVTCPRFALDPAYRAIRMTTADEGLKGSLRVRLSAGAAQALRARSVGEHLADDDDPGNSWLIGEGGEIFQLDFRGKIDTDSGFVCVVDVPTASRLGLDDSEGQEVGEGSAAASPAQTVAGWDGLREALAKTTHLWDVEVRPMSVAVPKVTVRFVGRVLSAPACAVYTRPAPGGGGVADGLLLHSDDA